MLSDMTNCWHGIAAGGLLLGCALTEGTPLQCSDALSPSKLQQAQAARRAQPFGDPQRKGTHPQGPHQHKSAQVHQLWPPLAAGSMQSMPSSSSPATRLPWPLHPLPPAPYIQPPKPPHLPLRASDLLAAAVLRAPFVDLLSAMEDPRLPLTVGARSRCACHHLCALQQALPACMPWRVRACCSPWVYTSAMPHSESR